jgi:hypothetical protein
MFPNNPLFVDKLVQSRQHDIQRGLPDPQTYDLRKTNKFQVKLRTNARIWAPAGLILLLVWWLHALI